MSVVLDRSELVTAEPLRPFLEAAIRRFGGVSYQSCTPHAAPRGRELAVEVPGYSRFVEHYAELSGISPRTAARRIAQVRNDAMIPRWLADEIACRSGWHPYIVLGAEWERGRV